MAYHLIKVSSGERLELPRDRAIVVGRSVTCDFALEEPTVSRLHAEVSVAEDGLMVKDLGSSNGTFVNGSRVGMAMVMPGDALLFGEAAFEITRDEEAAVPEIAEAESAETGKPPPEIPEPPPPEEAQAAEDRIPADAAFESDESTPVESEPEQAVPEEFPFEAEEEPGEGLPQTRMHAPEPREPEAEAAAAVEPEPAPEGEPEPAPEVEAALPEAGELRLSLVHDAATETPDRRLLQTARTLFEVQDRETLADEAAERVFEFLDVERVVLQIAAGDGGQSELRVHKGPVDSVDIGIEVPRTLVAKALSDGAAVIADRAGPRPPALHSALCVPLLSAAGEILGLLYADHRAVSRPYGEQDLERLVLFAGLITTALETLQSIASRVERAVARNVLGRHFAPAAADLLAGEDGAGSLAVAGHRAAVLACAITATDSLAERLEAAECGALLGRLRSALRAQVLEHGGMLAEFAGDRLLAVWGLPFGSPDDPGSALAAGLGMLDTVAGIDDAERPGLRIGIDLGEVVAGNVAESGLDYALAGPALQQAARLCTQAAPGELVISQACRDALRNPPETEALHPAYRVKRSFD